MTERTPIREAAEQYVESMVFPIFTTLNLAFHPVAPEDFPLEEKLCELVRCYFDFHEAHYLVALDNTDAANEHAYACGERMKDVHERLAQECADYFESNVHITSLMLGNVMMNTNALWTLLAESQDLICSITGTDKKDMPAHLKMAERISQLANIVMYTEEVALNARDMEDGRSGVSVQRALEERQQLERAQTAFVGQFGGDSLAAASQIQTFLNKRVAEIPQRP